MKQWTKDKRYTTRLNIEANCILARILLISLTLGSISFFLSRVVIYNDYTVDNVMFCLSLIVIGVSPSILIKLKIPHNITAVYINVITVYSYYHLSLKLIDSASTTIWASAFVLIISTILYPNKIGLVITSIGILSSTIFVWNYIPEVTITIHNSDHIGRVGLTVITIIICFYVNNIYRDRLAENIATIDEISKQKEEITQLYEEISASEEENKNQYSQLIAAHERINHMAYYDELTNLPRRYKLMDIVNEKIRIYSKNKIYSTFAILSIDLDNFKYINDLFGHEAGDSFLVKASKYITSALKDTPSVVVRTGGDEFVAVVENIQQKKALDPIVDKVFSAFDCDIEHNNISIHLTVSIGIAVFPNDGDTMEQLLKNSEIAMYHAKKLGKNNHQFFNEEIRNKLERKIILQDLLRKAIKEDEFELCYQPVVDIKNKSLKGFEALLRWNSKEMGSISPLEFIPLAEETGTIIEIGEWVLLTAIHKCKEIKEITGKDYTMAINISSIQLRNNEFVKCLKKYIDEIGVPSYVIELEITESVFIGDFDKAVELMRSIKELGVKISLDDFGTGYSSLAYLKQLPIDTLKIDKSFISFDHSKIDYYDITESIVSIGHKLNMEVIAEGVETKEQLNNLEQYACDHVQGYFFEKPLKEERVMEFIKSFNNEFKEKWN